MARHGESKKRGERLSWWGSWLVYLCSAGFLFSLLSSSFHSVRATSHLSGKVSFSGWVTQTPSSTPSFTQPLTRTTTTRLEIFFPDNDEEQKELWREWKPLGFMSRKWEAQNHTEARLWMHWLYLMYQKEGRIANPKKSSNPKEIAGQVMSLVITSSPAGHISVKIWWLLTSSWLDKLVIVC